jgi:uncharacterized integral membrane protein
MTAGPADNTQSGGQDAPALQAPAEAPVQLPTHRVRRTRMGGLWVAAVLSALVLLLLLIFILENGQRASISYFGAHGHMPLGVALLLAAVLGVLLVVIPGTGRIIQLRVAAHRHRCATTGRQDGKLAGDPKKIVPVSDGSAPRAATATSVAAPSRRPALTILAGAKAGRTNR